MSKKPSPSRTLLPLVLLFALACDSGSHPAAPAGTLLAIAAKPASVPLHGTSTIEVTALDALGGPVRAGTEIHFGTDLGDIEPVARTDSRGIARAVFAAGGIAGEAKVTATSGASDGTLNSVTTLVAIATGPEAAFSCAGSGLTVVFTDDTAGTPESWEWSFGDGATSRERNPVHAYRQPGSYQVALTVRGAGGESTATRFAVVPGSGDVCAVSVERPEASFTCAASGLTVIFSDGSTNRPTRWRWDFGDGRSSSAPSPTHVYSAAGTYVVTLTAANSAGEHAASKFVTVPDGGCP